jgi:hypothetical protein
MSDMLFFTNRDISINGSFSNIINEIKKNNPKVIFYSNLFEYEIDVSDFEFFELEKILVEMRIQIYFLFGAVNCEKHQQRYTYKNMRFICWETFFLLQTYKTFHSNISNLKIEDFNINVNFDRLYINYNHNPHKFRCLLMDKLNEHNLFNDGFNSWNKLTYDYFNGNKYNFKFWNENHLKIDEYYKNGYRVEISDTILEPKSFMNLVSESSDECLIFSEKTWKPILIEQPFLSYGAPNQNLKLKDYGFELYDEIFDYSFDRCLNLEDRVNGIIDNLKSLKNKNYNELHCKIKDKLIKNKKRAIEIVNNNLYTPNEFIEFYKKCKVHTLNDKYSLHLPEYVYEILEK